VLAPFLIEPKRPGNRIQGQMGLVWQFTVNGSESSSVASTEVSSSGLFRLLLILLFLVSPRLGHGGVESTAHEYIGCVFITLTRASGWM
jgi:hypothetical protein